MFAVGGPYEYLDDDGNYVMCNIIKVNGNGTYDVGISHSGGWGNDTIKLGIISSRMRKH